MSEPSSTSESNYRLPSEITLKHAAKLSIVDSIYIVSSDIPTRRIT